MNHLLLFLEWFIWLLKWKFVVLGDKTMKRHYGKLTEHLPFSSLQNHPIPVFENVNRTCPKSVSSEPEWMDCTRCWSHLEVDRWNRSKTFQKVWKVKSASGNFLQPSELDRACLLAHPGNLSCKLQSVESKSVSVIKPQSWWIIDQIDNRISHSLIFQVSKSHIKINAGSWFSNEMYSHICAICSVNLDGLADNLS